LPQSVLNQGFNFIELVQRRVGGDWGIGNVGSAVIHPDREWGVTDLLISDPVPDVAVSSVVLGERETLRSIPLNALIENIGSTFIDNATVQFFLSEDNIVNQGDIFIGSRTFVDVPISQTTISTTSGNLNSNRIRNGLYYGACVVPVGGELNIANNCFTGGQLDLSFVTGPAILQLLMDDE